MKMVAITIRRKDGAKITKCGLAQGELRAFIIALRRMPFAFIWKADELIIKGRLARRRA